MLELLLVPTIACLVLAGIHCYLGIHVLMREVIFVDLALAQIAALGLTIGMAMGFAPESNMAYLLAVAFTLIGALAFALGRFRDRRVPQEALIGIVYVVSAAVMILVFSQLAIERDHVERMLTGRLLFVDWPEVMATTILYAIVGAIHIVFRRPFLSISDGSAASQPWTIRILLWDFLFYGTFGLVVVSSVRIAGVLLVFSFLVIPASCAFLYFQRVRSRLLAGWAFGLIASVVGLWMSGELDLPTGPSVVVAFGALFVLSVGGYAVLLRVRTKRT
ncbi:MAG: metal ABC transporter permease [Phycisphaerales bacterium]|nr:metal ABC transporter permease [Phycisphaerales bacterium]MCI0629698.1 metal ABC transporter permease [Phycisphaerales bacterium]MCI0675421.1 metal ABC transporter permease [Phycisphaerales bacterium]